MDDPRHDLAKEIAERAQKSLETGESPRDLHDSVLAALTEQERQELRERMESKDVVRRFSDLVPMVLDLANGQKRLVTGETLTERASQLAALIAHVLNLWRDARTLFIAERFSTSAFLAIASMEETGKVGIAKLQMLFAQAPTVHARTDQRRALYSHTQKHLLVAGQGALINARLDRLFGLERIAQFLDDVEAGRIERIRQSALYADHDGAKPLLPEERISKEEALFHVALAGEVMAEVLGAVPEIRRELLDEVVAFERDQGIALPDDLGQQAPNSRLSQSGQ